MTHTLADRILTAVRRRENGNGWRGEVEAVRDRLIAINAPILADDLTRALGRKNAQRTSPDAPNDVAMRVVARDITSMLGDVR